MSKFLRWCSGGLWLLAALAVGAAETKSPLRVTVSIPPQAALVRQLAGPLAKVSVLLPAGKSPHDYAPLPSQVTELADSNLFFTVGMPFEKTIADKMRGQTAGSIVDMSAGIKRRMAVEDHDGDEDASLGDPHVWTTPENLRLMAANACAALCRAEPAHAVEFKANYEKFSAQMTALDHKLAAELAPFRGHVLYVYHPAFGYFTDRYGLKQEAIEEQGKDPSPKQIMNLIAAARKAGVKVILVQKQFNTRSAEKIAAAIHGHVLAVDNLDPDVVRMIMNIADAVKLGVSAK